MLISGKTGKIFKIMRCFRKPEDVNSKRETPQSPPDLRKNALCVSLDYTSFLPLTVLNLESIALMKFSVVSAYICILIKYII